jgi:hypothetical protein
MKHISFNYKVISNIVLTRAEINHLKHVSSIHYDEKCKNAGRLGGFIYGWYNMLGTDDEVEISATFKQLDLITKILEMENLPQHVISGIQLATAFNDEAKRAQDESISINSEIEQAFNDAAYADALFEVFADEQEAQAEQDEEAEGEIS